MRTNICSLASQAFINLQPEFFLLFLFSALCFGFLDETKKKKKRRQRMPKSNDEGSEITFLVEDLEAILEMNKLLEDENAQLKQEVTRLKAQVSALKAHDLERKSLLWKKIQSPDRTISTTTTNFPPHPKKPPPSDPMDPPLKPGKPTPPPAPRPKLPGGVIAPPPPPLPTRSDLGGRAVKRVPEVVEFYRYLTKKTAQSEKKGSCGGGVLEPNSKNMIGEIEDRSTYLSAIKSDVETKGGLIKRLICEIENAAFTEISAAESFVKWVDGELSCLVDERAVLKHFPRWPERKADALREAACSYRDLRSLEAEILALTENPKQSLGKIQTMQDRLERSVGNVERTRDGTSKRYRELQIPWEWMMDTGFIGKIKLSALKLATEYMKRVGTELQNPRCAKVNDLMVQGVRFAYRVHQFSGGFDSDTMTAFEELKQMYSNNHS